MAVSHTSWPLATQPSQSNMSYATVTEYEKVEAETEDFINGAHNAQFQFFRANGAATTIICQSDWQLLVWLGQMLKAVYTPRLMASPARDDAFLPLNPFAVIRSQLELICLNTIQNVSPRAQQFDFCSFSFLSAGVTIQMKFLSSEFEMFLDQAMNNFSSQPMDTNENQRHEAISGGRKEMKKKKT